MTRIKVVTVQFISVPQGDDLLNNSFNCIA